MTDFPVIFSAPMIRALLSGEKTMTRRLAWAPVKKPRPVREGDRLEYVGNTETGVGKVTGHFQPTPWQRVKPGDRLWVRERVCSHSGFGFPLGMCPQHNHMQGQVWSYFADGVPDPTGGKPSIHMPRWVSRITIVVMANKVEPLQAISEEDAAAEGIVRIERSLTRHGRMDGYGAPGTSPEDASTTRVNAFRRLWQSLHGSESWDSNPEVVAISGKVIAKNIDKVAA
jgi:hypothetical protein